MEITNMDLFRQKMAIEGRLSVSDMIKEILKDDDANPAKTKMRQGEAYYRGEHDILGHDFQKGYYYDDDNKKREIKNENNSNHHNIHNFYGLQVDQKTAYIAGRPPSVSVEGARSKNADTGAPEENEKLLDFETDITAVSSDELFTDTIHEYITNSTNGGQAWLHMFYDRAKALRYALVPAVEVIPFYDTEHQTQLVELIRYYSIAMVKNGWQKLLKKVEWWTERDVTYFEETDNGEFVLDMSYKPNPAGHWIDTTITDGAERRREAQSWGRVPFIPLFNNSTHMGDLERIKSLQDAYNLISSASTNNQIDLVELYWIIQGFGGETVKAVQQRLKYNKAVEVSDPQGKVQAEQVTLSVQDRIAWLGMLRKDIYHLGMAVDTDADKFGNAPSGVSLKFQYTLLDQKADMLISKLNLSMKEFFWYLTEDINRRNGTQYDSTLVRFDVNKSVITSVMEMAQMVSLLQGFLPDTILYSLLPFVDDVAQAMDEMQSQRAAEAKRQRDAFLNSDVPYGSEA